MKIKYQKPQILFESFEMATSIAASCNYVETKLPSQAEYCAVYLADVPSVRIFDRDVASSTCNTEPAGIYDAICYQVPNDAYNVYTSG